VSAAEGAGASAASAEARGAAFVPAEARAPSALARRGDDFSRGSALKTCPQREHLNVGVSSGKIRSSIR
jgi:hypothetical protein